MRPIHSSTCLTRIVDGDHNIEITELTQVMTRIQDAVCRVIPPAHQIHVGNALLHLALEHLVQEGGSQRTASTLIRLIDSVLEHDADQAGTFLGPTTAKAKS